MVLMIMTMLMMTMMMMVMRIIYTPGAVAATGVEVD